jgi:hypothetical protein
MRKKLLLVICLTFTFSVTVFSRRKEKTPSVSELSPALKKLDVWIGHWTTQRQAKDTPYSRARSISSETTCAWSANHGYMICDQLINDAGVISNELSIYTYSEREKAYKFFGLDMNGQPRSVPLTIEGNVWTYGGKPFEANGKKIQIRTTNEFVSPTTVIFRTEYSDDGGAHWTLINEGKDTKVK